MSNLFAKRGGNPPSKEQVPEDNTGKVILGEIVGGTNLHCSALKDDSTMSPFVVVLRVQNTKLEGKQSQEVLVRTKACKNTNNPIYCINHRCLFLFTTPETEEDIDSCKIQFDARDKSDLLVTNQLVVDPLECRLVGSRTMSLRDVIDVCCKRPEERIEVQLEAPFATSKANYVKNKTIFTKKKAVREESCEEDSSEDMNMIAVRFRFATAFDKDFMEKLGKLKESQSFATYLNHLGNTPGTLTAKITSKKTSKNTSKPKYITKKVQHQIAEPTYNNISGESRETVQPGPDPDRPKSTKYLTKEQMEMEMSKPSTKWTQMGGGTKDGDLGELYLEILNCEKLPNTSAPDGILGFGCKTDPFVCVMYDEFFAHTDIIENRLSPMWMPWSQRSFCFSIKHPFSQLFLSVNDYNSIADYFSIGRIQINLNHFEPDITYTLKYNFFPASTVNDRESCGAITVRLRKVIKDEKALLMSTFKPLPNLHVNIENKSHLSVARFTCYGKNDEDIYDVMFIWYYIKEILDLIKFGRFAIQDAIGSLIMWRGQVKIRDVYLPVHSAIAFVGGIYAVERPHLWPACFFLSFAWFMLAAMIHRQQNPSIWHKTNSFFYYLAVLLNIKPTKNQTMIKSMENAEAAAIYEANWEHRITFSQELGRRSRDMNFEVARIGNENLNDEKKKKASIKDPIAIVAENLKEKLFPLQKRLRCIVNVLRHIKVVTNWEESLLSFWLTLFFLTFGILLLFLPSVTILHWSCRIFIWVCLGPWFRIYHDITTGGVDIIDMRSEEYIEKFSSFQLENLLKKFEKKGRAARLKGEEAAKLKAMRNYTFGKYIARVPAMGVTRWYDYPLSESSAAHVSIEPEYLNVVPSKIVDSQHLEGKMIPRGETADREQYYVTDGMMMDSFIAEKRVAQRAVLRDDVGKAKRGLIGVFKKKKS